MADSNRTALYYYVEDNWGATTAASLTTAQQMRITGESLGFNIESITSAEIRSDRAVTDLIQTGANPSGGFNFEFSPQAFDKLIEGAMWSSWSTYTWTTAATITNGTTEKDYTFARVHEDVLDSTNPLIMAFTGMVCNSWNMTVSANSVISGSFDYIGKTATVTNDATSYGGTELYGTTDYTAAPAYEVMNAVTDAASANIKMGAVSTTPTATLADSNVYVQDMSFSIANNVRGQAAVGVLGNADIGVGQLDVTGNLTAYLANKDMYAYFLANTARSFLFTLGDSSAKNTYTFHFPNIKFESDAINASGANSDVMENLTWRALYDSTFGYTMKITRSANQV